MPAPITKRPQSKHTATHRVVLESGKSYTLNDPQRLGSPWTFHEGIPVEVPEHIALRLKEKAVDNVTVKAGSKITGREERKFKIERIGAPASASEE